MSGSANDLIAAVGSAALGVVVNNRPSLVDNILHNAGLYIPLPALIVGLCFSAAGGFVAMAINPPGNHITKYTTLFTALLVGMLAAEIHPHIPAIKDFPIQGVMIMAGLCSRKIVEKVTNLDFPTNTGGKP